MQNLLSMQAKSSQTITNVTMKHRLRLQKQRIFLPYIVHDYLLRNCSEIARMFFTKMRLNNDIVVSDNAGLEAIFDDFITAFYSKTADLPQLCYKVGANKKVSDIPQRQSHDKDSGEEAVHCNNKDSGEETDEESVGPESAITVTSIFGNNSNNVTPEGGSPLKHLRKLQHSKPIKNLYPHSTELQDVANSVAMEVVVNSLNVQWEDIIGYDKCKRDLCNTVFFPLWCPQIYSKKFSPCSSILLHGPPGTGKTMLAKAVATACECMFFNITSSSIVSKWRGDSEKYIRVLFDLAAYWAPSIIFIDEIDWVTSCDSDCSSTSDPARRFRAEFLSRFDGLLTQTNKNVCLLAATNLPWTMDGALLRRFEKKILVNLPNEETRQRIFEYYISKTESNSKIISELVKKSDNYSCADIKLVCKEARIAEILEDFPFVISSIGLTKEIRQEIKMPENYPDTIKNANYVLDLLSMAKPRNSEIKTRHELWPNK